MEKQTPFQENAMDSIIKGNVWVIVAIFGTLAITGDFFWKKEQNFFPKIIQKIWILDNSLSYMQCKIWDGSLNKKKSTSISHDQQLKPYWNFKFQVFEFLFSYQKKSSIKVSHICMLWMQSEKSVENLIKCWTKFKF